MNTLQHFNSLLPNKFRFVLAALLFVMGLSQISAFTANEASAVIVASSKCAHFNEFSVKSTHENLFIEDIEIEEETDDDNNAKNHAAADATSISSAWFLIYTPIQNTNAQHLLRLPNVVNTTVSTIPLYALHCNWRHHLV